MKVVVTGASGYIGRHVVAEYLAKGHEVVAVDLVNNGVPEGATFRSDDILHSQEDLYELWGQPDVILHMAWQDGFVHTAPSHIGMLSNHFSFLQRMMEAGCKNIAVMGSMHEVGFWEGAIDEHTPCEPLSPYGVAKNALRQLMQVECKKFGANLYWLRGFYIYGDDLKNHSIFTKLMQAAEEGKKTFPFTMGQTKYDFLTVEEMAEQIVAATTQSEITGIINICSGNPVTLADQVEGFIRKNNLDISLQYGAFPDRAYDSKIIYGDATKIHAIMNKAK